MIHHRVRNIPLCLVLLAGTLAFGNLSAYTLEEFKFETPGQHEAFRDLIAKLRCLVCQNESLAGSQAGVAQDLREEVYRMMLEGQSDEEIVTFLVDRYGDFVLYEPPIKPSTYLLWFGPFIFLGVAGYMLFRTLGRKKDEPEEDLTEAERTRLQRLLAADGDNQDKLK
ncbi:Cytochrome C biogenesis protein [Thiocapsa sp. KS1]|jgi:cytochrome c-type biogenesis protein CcmH|nr:cytochrome c-type biogenesis protein [Thiocapsa sp. KS1]CRI66711.1 Cytochrome C biogenesis protein [Thiocapsa sp. KS1]